MLTRTVAGFAVGLAGLLFITSKTPAQPGKGGGDSIKKLEADLQKLRDTLKQAEADLAKAKATEQGGRGYGGWGRGRGFGGMDKKDFDKKADFFMKKEGFKKEAGKMDPDTIKERYEFYKKLYDALPKEKAKGTPGGGAFGTAPGGFGGGRPGGGFGPGGFGFGGGGPSTGSSSGSSSIEARLDRLMRELEELRKELKKK
jgi:hypothetical protein